MIKPLYTLTGLTEVLIIAACSTAFATHQIVHTPDNRIANQVLHQLLSSPLGKTMPRLHYHVTLIAAAPANAYSNYQGQICISAGLFPALYTDRGVWAAVIGHELGHVILHNPKYLPQFKAKLRQDYLKSRSGGVGQGVARWPSVPLGKGISKLTLSREEELQADFIGMMLMAEAGYQPGFAALLEQRLRHGLGDTPGIFAVLSHHPRMETREKQTAKFYRAAKDIFHMRWPDAAKSPGGNLPPYGKIDAWTLRQTGGQLVFQVPFKIYNAEGMQVRIAAIFLDKKRRVAPADPKYRASDGTLVLNALSPGARDKSGEAELRVPIAEIAAQDRHVTAVVFLMAGDRWVDISKRAVDLPAK